MQDLAQRLLNGGRHLARQYFYPAGCNTDDIVAAADSLGTIISHLRSDPLYSRKMREVYTLVGPHRMVAMTLNHLTQEIGPFERELTAVEGLLRVEAAKEKEPLKKPQLGLPRDVVYAVLLLAVMAMQFGQST